jgi:hypothetical protein
MRTAAAIRTINWVMSIKCLLPPSVAPRIRCVETPERTFPARNQGGPAPVFPQEVKGTKPPPHNQVCNTRIVHLREAQQLGTIRAGHSSAVGLKGRICLPGLGGWVGWTNPPTQAWNTPVVLPRGRARNRDLEGTSELTLGEEIRGELCRGGCFNTTRPIAVTMCAHSTSSRNRSCHGDVNWQRVGSYSALNFSVRMPNAVWRIRPWPA